MAIRPKAVLTALNQRPHNGVLRAAGTDAAVKLLRSMSLRAGLIDELRERLHEMSETGEIVIECEGNRFDLIATPDALKNANDETKDGEETVIAPPGQRRTTSPRDGQGHELPAHLGPQHVGPLTITYKDQAAGEAIATAADLVREEIVKSGKLRYGRDELLAAIQAHLLPLYDEKAEVAQTLAGPVLSNLLSCGHAKRVPVPGRRNEHVIEIVLPDPAEVEQQAEDPVSKDFDPVAVLAVLAPELEAARQRLTELETRNAELETLNESAVSPDVVARLTEKAEGLQTEAEDFRRKLEEKDAEIEGLQQQLEAAEAEKKKILDSHKERLRKVRADHESTLTTRQRQHERALAAVNAELEAARSENASLQEAAARKQTLPEDLRLRVEKLLGN